MKKYDEWIKEYDYLNINNTKYWFKCNFALPKKMKNRTSPAMELEFQIYKDGEGWMDWNDFKDTYIAEKMTDYIMNTINGQRAVYYDVNKNKTFR